MIHNGLVTSTEPDSDSDPDSNPICVLCSWDENLNLSLYGVKSSALYNVAIGFQSELESESESGSGNVNKP